MNSKQKKIPGPNRIFFSSRILSGIRLSLSGYKEVHGARNRPPISAIRATLFRAHIEPGLPFRTPRFPVPQEMVSTPTEKTTICHYFLKPAKKKTLQTCNTAGFLSPRFSRWAIGGGRGKKDRYCEESPGKKILIFVLFRPFRVPDG
ncbi:hypothetical protein Mboo_0989 [Methanoregula boonei 6A8]|uniref:Uncharacterized protein n=1 Tax=Methanoregula boonei (strain DSM 21154 / JCM 14090 / 6A8) TaxID=456442 RepID=A7I6Z6_METB6|nr:hypothetical protein Mboo_0989 [Methanoregula boonei 6A8]